jgi:hypothetical protein
MFKLLLGFNVVYVCLKNQLESESHRVGFKVQVDLYLLV